LVIRWNVTRSQFAVDVDVSVADLEARGLAGTAKLHPERALAQLVPFIAEIDVGHVALHPAGDLRVLEHAPADGVVALAVGAQPERVVHRDVAGLDLEVERAPFTVHRAHETLGKRRRVPIDHEVAHDNVLARIQGKKTRRRRADDDLGAVAAQNHLFGPCHGQGVVGDLGVLVRLDIGIEIVPALGEAYLRGNLRFRGPFHRGTNPRCIVLLIVRHGTEVGNFQHLLDREITQRLGPRRKLRLAHLHIHQIPVHGVLMHARGRRRLGHACRRQSENRSQKRGDAVEPDVRGRNPATCPTCGGPVFSSWHRSLRICGERVLIIAPQNDNRARATNGSPVLSGQA
jgi:hypothetical protein